MAHTEKFLVLTFTTFTLDLKTLNFKHMETRKNFLETTEKVDSASFVPESNRKEAQTVLLKFLESITNNRAKEHGDMILGCVKDITEPWIMYAHNPTLSFVGDVRIQAKLMGLRDVSNEELSRIESLYISKIRKIMKKAQKMWKIPNVEAVYISKEDRHKLFKSLVNQDALAFVIATDGYLKVGDKLGAWKVVNVSDDKKVAKLSNGKKDFTIELWFKCKSKGRVKFCWVNHIRMDLYEIKTTDEVIEKDMLS